MCHESGGSRNLKETHKYSLNFNFIMTELIYICLNSVYDKCTKNPRANWYRPVRRSAVRILKMRTRLCDCSHNPINAAGLLGKAHITSLIILLVQWHNYNYTPGTPGVVVVSLQSRQNEDWSRTEQCPGCRLIGGRARQHRA